MPTPAAAPSPGRARRGPAPAKAAPPANPAPRAAPRARTHTASPDGRCTRCGSQAPARPRTPTRSGRSPVLPYAHLSQRSHARTRPWPVGSARRPAALKLRWPQAGTPPGLHRGPAACPKRSRSRRSPGVLKHRGRADALAPVYTLKRASRRKPIKVIPASAASSTARLDGAETPASTGMPARAAFCTSSKLNRPLTTATLSLSGTSPASSAAPISLSMALCLPTSSRRRTRDPSGANSPAACRPPSGQKPAARREGAAPARRQLPAACWRSARTGAAHGLDGCLAAHPAA